MHVISGKLKLGYANGNKNIVRAWQNYAVSLYIAITYSWWRHQMETFFHTLCEGNPPVASGFPSQRPVTRSFDVFFDLYLNKRLGEQSRRWWFDAHYDATVILWQDAMVKRYHPIEMPQFIARGVCYLEYEKHVIYISKSQNAFLRITI